MSKVKTTATGNDMSSLVISKYFYSVISLSKTRVPRLLGMRYHYKH